MNLDVGLEERVFILSKVFQAIPMYFAHWEDSFVEPDQLDETYRQYLHRALELESRVEFSKLMYEFFGLLNNGHTTFHDSSLLANNPGMGFGMDWVDHQWIVIASRIDGLEVGEAVISLNGTPVETLYREVEPFIRRGSEHATRMAFGGGVWRAFGFPLRYELAWEDRLGEIHTTVIDRDTLPAAEPGGSSNPETEGRWINDIAYIRIPSFEDAKFEESALDYLSDFQHARALIIDVRHNGGGTTPTKLRQALIDKPFRTGSFSSPQQIGIQQDWAGWGQTQLLWPSRVVHPGNCVFKGCLYVLANRRTGSASEDFVSTIKASGRGIIIGEFTYGSTGQPVNFDCGDGFSFRISTIRCYNPDGSKFEGVGIEPDVKMESTREGIYIGEDHGLDLAVKHASS